MTTMTDAAAPIAAREHRFFLNSAFAMTFLIVAGFSLNLAMGRSTFASPLLLHAHALVFMGWVTINLLQNVFAATGRTALHRRLGWLATGWIAVMLVLGVAVTVAMVRRGGVPFFFRPLQFLVFDPVSLVAFVGLTTAAVLLRRQTEWHRRLHYCAMATLVGPAFGRLLPMPLMAPWAWEGVVAAVAIFPLVGIVWDKRRNGRVHPAWAWGLGVMAATVLVTESITYSGVGQALYRQVTAGSPGAAVPPLAFPPPPGPPPGAAPAT